MDNNLKTKEYQVCTRCVMDTTATEITFDERGYCNFCNNFEAFAKDTIWRLEEVKARELKESIEKVKRIGKDDKYDCIIGLSGGVDSSYLCYWAKQMGLRPLIVHFDNGWNSELAVKNIENIISQTGFDLYTYVINWEEFKDLQLSYFKAGVIDLEVPTDQLIFAALYHINNKFKIKTLIKGNNNASEYILPRSWHCADKFDYVNMMDIHRRFGTVKLKNFPRLDLITQVINDTLFKLNTLAPLDLLNYDKTKAKILLEKEFGWRDYGGKHYESIFTRFYQGYILPTRFNVDKRRAHLSTLVADKTMTREVALAELEKPGYDPDVLREDYEFVLKKFEISKEEFEGYMKLPIVAHDFYATQWDKNHFRKYYIFKKLILPLLKVFYRTKI